MRQTGELILAGGNWKDRGAFQGWISQRTDVLESHPFPGRLSSPHDTGEHANPQHRTGLPDVDLRLHRDSPLLFRKARIGDHLAGHRRPASHRLDRGSFPHPLDGKPAAGDMPADVTTTPSPGSSSFFSAFSASIASILEKFPRVSYGSLPEGLSVSGGFMISARSMTRWTSGTGDRCEPSHLRER